MNPLVSNETEDRGVLQFTLTDANVSIANALRRTMLSDVPCVVFRTAPYAESRVDITVNTTRMNNELIKQRLSCVPIHIKDTAFPLENYEIELDVTNDSDTVRYITTKDLVIKDVATGNPIAQHERDAIFPSDPLTSDYIDLVRLRPRISEEIGGERLAFTAKLDIGTAREDGAFNVVSCATYAATPDPVAIADAWDRRAKELRKEGREEAQIEYDKKDWHLLEGQRYHKDNSFDFRVETVGQFENRNVVERAAHIILAKLDAFRAKVESEQETMIKPSEATLENGFDIELEGEGYTLGKIVEYVLYEKHYKAKDLTYCGFLKPHPHIDNSMLRIGFKDRVERAAVVAYLADAVEDLKKVYRKIASAFSNTADA